MKDIVVKNIKKSYGGKEVLKSFSAVFPAGCRVCVMGESGSGKTTLLRLITGLEKPDEGSITGVPERVSVVFQEDRLCEDFSIISNIRMVLDKEQDISDAQIDSLLRDMGMTEPLDTPVRLLSGGMKRRVAIARALVYDSELLIMDEPFKGLDETTKDRVIQAVKKRREAVLMVSHDLQEAKKMEAEIFNIK